MKLCSTRLRTVVRLVDSSKRVSGPDSQAFLTPATASTVKIIPHPLDDRLEGEERRRDDFRRLLREAGDGRRLDGEAYAHKGKEIEGMNDC